MRYAVLALLALAACGTERRGNGAVIINECVEGATRACACTDGRNGSQTCVDKKYDPCACSGVIPDGGSSSPDAQTTTTDGGANASDAGGNTPHDAGDDRRPDAGFPPVTDAGFPHDSGPRPPHDSGVPQNPPDSGVPTPRDAGRPPPRDAGTPPSSDGGLIGEGGPCVTDADCNIGLPFPLLICENNICEIGCLFSMMCPVGTTCDLFTGRCL